MRGGATYFYSFRLFGERFWVAKLITNLTKLYWIKCFDGVSHGRTYPRIQVPLESRPPTADKTSCLRHCQEYTWSGLSWTRSSICAKQSRKHHTLHESDINFQDQIFKISLISSSVFKGSLLQNRSTHTCNRLLQRSGQLLALLSPDSHPHWRCFYTTVGKNKYLKHMVIKKFTNLGGFV